MGRVRELTRFTVRTRAARTDKHGRTACASKVSGPGFLGRNKKASVHFLLAKNLGSVAKISSAAGLGLGKLSVWKT